MVVVLVMYLGEKFEGSLAYKGSVILINKPFAHVLQSSLRGLRCDECYSEGREGHLLRCAACKVLYFCNRECQKKSWKDHKMECRCLQRVFPRVPPDFVRLMARVILKLQRGGDLISENLDKGKTRAFQDLESHSEEVGADSKKQEHVLCVRKVLEDYIGDVPEATDMLSIYGKMCINSYSIVDEEMNPVGTGLYLSASILDHSCDPNAIGIFQGNVLHVRLIKDIPDFSLSQVYISYIDTFNSRQSRRKELMESYYFWCECLKCQDLQEEKSMTAARCTRCNSAVEVVDAVLQSCSSCGFDSFTQDDHHRVSQLTSTTIKNKTVEAYESFISKQEKLLSPLHILYVKTLNEIFDISIKEQKWEDAIQHGLKILKAYRVYLGEYHPLKGIHLLKIGKLQLYLCLPHAAASTLAEASSILQVSHGKDHPWLETHVHPLLLQCQQELRS